MGGSREEEFRGPRELAVHIEAIQGKPLLSRMPFPFAFVLCTIFVLSARGFALLKRAGNRRFLFIDMQQVAILKVDTYLTLVTNKPFRMDAGVFG